MATPNIGLPTAPNGSTNISAAYNDAMQVLDALTQLAVEDKDLTVAPTTLDTDAGKRWIVATGASGVWAGQAGNIALCTAADQWRFLPAQEGFKAWVIDEGADYRYTGGAWVLVA
jgi:hypothetical protein